jgi:hypothetical protein
MALTIFPSAGYDSMISLSGAMSVIEANSLQAPQWIALSDETQEVYLRIATTRILNSVSYDYSNPAGYLDEATYVAEDSCLPKSCALMAIHDLAYGLSSEINPQTGLVAKEKVGDLEVTYIHGANASSRQLSSRETNPFPASVQSCLRSYGAILSNGGFAQATLERS